MPLQVLWFEEGGGSVKVLFPEKCKNCYKCVKACREGALRPSEWARPADQPMSD